MKKNIEQISSVYPPAFNDCADLLQKVDPEAPFAIFGGAVRDSYYAAHLGRKPKIHDYDIRVWLPESDHQERTVEFVRRLGEISGSDIERKPTINSNRIRYYLSFKDVELDISIREPVTSSLDIARVAIERAGDADAGISSVAMAPDGTTWATSEFLNDIGNRTITMYPRPNSGNRLPEYAEHMRGKFPDHIVVWF